MELRIIEITPAAHKYGDLIYAEFRLDREKSSN